MNLPKKLASQSALIFLARIFGAGLMFVGQAAIARAWGQAVLGEYLVVIATANLFAAFMPLGFQTIGTYFAAEYRAKGQGHMLRRFAGVSYALLVIMAVVMVSVALPIFHRVGPSGAIVCAHYMPMALIAGSTALMFVNASLLVGLKRPFAGFLIDALVRPALLIAVFLVVLGLADGGIGALIRDFSFGFAAISLVHFALTLWILRRVPNRDEQAVPFGSEFARWWRFALPWVLVALATDFFFDLDLVALSALMTPDDLAIFGVCARIFSLAAFGVASVYAVSLPEVFEAEALKDRSGFLKRIGDANVVASGLSLLLFAGAGLIGPFALLLFGTGFLAGSAPLAVLCLSLFVRSAFGPTSLVLSIYDRPYASLPAVGAGLLSLIGANLLLVPSFGLMGASLAALFAITIWSGSLWLTTRHLIGIDVSIMPRLLARSGRRVGMASAE